VFLLVALTTTLVTFVLPESYLSTVRIAIDKDVTDVDRLSGQQRYNTWDPYYIQTEFEKIQSKAILEMRLQRLTGMERKKIDLEYTEVLAFIEELRFILGSPEKQMQIIREELLKVREVYGDERRTEIVPQEGDFSIEDMIAQEDVVITITHEGFIKRFPVSGYRRQARGGKGVRGSGQA
jgi:DNA gyrase/topoisomerase IV subunit A